MQRKLSNGRKVVTKIPKRRCWYADLLSTTALRLLDPSIVLILCGKDGYSDWDRYVLQECITSADMHSIHLYTSDKEYVAISIFQTRRTAAKHTRHLPNVTSPLAAERAIQITASLIDLARIEPNTSAWPVETTQFPRTEERPTICFDEWNVWDSFRSPGDIGAEESYDVSDALAVGVWLNVFIRQSEYLGMCNIAQSVNVISPLMTTKTGIVKQTTYWPLLLFTKYMRGKTLAVNLRCPEWKGERTNPEWIRSTVKTPWLDVAAALDDNDWVNLSVVNISEVDDFETKVAGVTGEVEVYTVGAQTKSIRESNMNNGDVKIVQSRWDGQGSYTFPKHSMTILRWQS